MVKKKQENEEEFTELHLIYRPSNFDEVIGHEKVISSLQIVLKKDQSHSFLFSGKSGVGKTTLARIIAKEVGCLDPEIHEIDAATHTGVDDMRTIADHVQYRPLLGTKKCLIVDEAHSLTKQAWQALLKSLEEPPRHAYWVLCTTEPSKVPKTIKTRCAYYHLDSVSDDDILSLVKFVMKDVGIKIHPEVVKAIVASAEGSPRQALVNLVICQNCTAPGEVYKLVRVAGEDSEVIDLCRYLVKGKYTWSKTAKFLTPLKQFNPESIRLIISSYLSACVLNCKSENEAVRLLNLLRCFTEPYPSQDKLGPVLVAIADATFETEED